MFTLSDNEVVQRFFNIKGFFMLYNEIKVIETTNNVGQNYANALYQSYDVTSYSRLLWQDPTLTGWNCRTSYRWTIQHTPSQGILRSVLPPLVNWKCVCLLILSTQREHSVQFFASWHQFCFYMRNFRKCIQMWMF